ncbi:choice-of-anchor J domain-containing protein [Flavobacterium croceum]|uniref:choice-of-anchor J domain-containing protein n=1 Tax=Flavobacterium croceum TaxID=370975 RepID=UPI0024A835FB|nr:choice-of-anchor J domain-containing protein [Flavobacterium croceum]
MYIKTVCDATTASDWAGPFSFKTKLIGTLCTEPIIINPTTTTPYSLSGNLANYQNASVTYTTQGTNCLSPAITGNYLNGAKVFFSFTPTQTGLITVTTSTANTTPLATTNCYNHITGTFIYNGCSNVGVNCLAGMNTSAANTPKQIPNFYVQAGQTYIIVLSSSLTQTAGICFNISVNYATCPAPATFTYKDLQQTSGLFSWDNNGSLVSNWQYLVQPAATAAPSASTTGTATTTNIDNTVSGLTAATAYKLYVRSVCGGTPGAWSVGYPFTTQCNTFNTPYSQDFTGTSTTVPAPCWTALDVNNDGVTWSYLSSAATMQTSTYQNYNNDMFISPQINFSGVQKRIRYKYAVNSGTSKYSVKISTTGIGASNFTYTLLPETTITNTTLTEKIINIPTSVTGLVNIAFVVSPGTGSTATRINIDDVFIEDKPACSTPITPSVVTGSITTTSAQFQWTLGDTETQWEYVIVPQGDAVTTGTPVLTSSNPLTVNGLTHATRYDFYIRAYCSSSLQSAWVGPLNFVTLCSSFDAPYTETFNDVDPTTKKFCWSINNVNNDAAKWTISATEAAILRGFNGPTSFNDWIISPAINTVGNKKLTFKYRALATPFTPNPRAGLEVLISTTDTNPSSFTVIQPLFEFTNTVYAEKSLYFTGNGPVYIAFRVPPTMTSPGTVSTLNLDDINIVDAPPCPNPANLAVANITQTNATFSWLQGYAENQWQIAIQPQGTGLPTSGTVINTNPYTTTTLSPNTAYEVYIRANCTNNNTTSDWVGPVPFRTLCTAYNTPFVETFNTDSTSEECWRVVNNNNDANPWNMNVTVNPYEGNQMAGMFTGSNGANDDWLISPPINIQPNQRLRYYYRVNNSSFTEDLKIKVSTNGVELSEFTTTIYDSDTDPVLINNTYYKEKVINLPASLTGVINIAFQVPYRAPEPIGYRGQLLFIDKVIVEDIPVCATPTNVIMQNVLDTSAQVTWNANAGETSWEVVVQPYGTPAPTATANPLYSHIATSIPYTVTGLNASTKYQVYVRAICNASTQSVWTTPIEFNTKCNMNDLCEYTFTLSGGTSNGVGGDFDIYQNGAIVQSFSFPTGPANVTPPPVDVTVFLCNGTQFSLFWDSIGTALNQYPNAVIQIKNSSGTVVWTSPAGLGVPRTTLYTGVPTCGTITCPQPTNLTVNSQGVLSWTAGGTETQWEVAIQPVGNGTIPQSGTIVSSPTYTPTVTDFANLTSGTYEFLVRAICGSGNTSYWSGPKVFITNDDASHALTVPVNNTNLCTNTATKVSFVGATPSSESSSCSTVNNGDIWFQFMATSKVHVIEANGFTGNFYQSSGDEPYPNMMMTLYKVLTDGSLQQVTCSENNSIVAQYMSELVVGTTYKLRLTLISPTQNTRQFEICIKTPSDLCNVDVVNGGFEEPPMPFVTGVSTISTQYVVPGWRVNLNTWSSIFFTEELNSLGAGPIEGGQCIQLLSDPEADWNPSDPNIKGLYKDLDSSELTQINYNFAHAARNTSGSSVQLFAGPPSGPFTLVTESYSPGALWIMNSGSYNVPTGQNITRFIFRSKQNIIGNLLDAVNFKGFNGINTPNKTLTCSQVTTSVDAEGLGVWEADSSNPAETIIENPNNATTNISGFNTSGIYKYHWKTRYCDNIITITYQGISTTPTTSPVGLCLNETASALTATVPSGYTLMWYTTSVGGTGSTTAPIPSTNLVGTTTYYVSAVDSAGCIGPRASIVVTVNTLPTASISGTTTICSGTGATISFNGTPNATVSYTINGGATQTIVLNNSGSASVSTGNLSSSATYALVSVSSATTPSCSQTVTGSAVVSLYSIIQTDVSATCIDYELQLTTSPINNSYNTTSASYQWVDSNGVSVGSNSDTFNVNDYLEMYPNASFPLTFTVTVSQNGCSGSDSIIIENHPCKLIPKGISPNGDGDNDRFDLNGLGVNELVIFNRYGTKVYAFQGKYTNQWNGLSDDGKELPDGTYFYSIVKDNGTTVTGWVYINRQY